jgi:hypothetical protein
MEPVAGWVFGAGLFAMAAVIHYTKNQVANGNINRNSAIGIRTKATMSSDRAWAAGHAAATPMLTATYLTAYSAGLITLAVTLAVTWGDFENPAVIIVPLAGIATVLALLSTAAAKANSAARAAEDGNK